MPKIDSDAATQALNDLGHLSSAVGHNVINAFSAIVSNAELLRIKAATNAIPIDNSTIANLIIESAIEASAVARRLIDFTRPITSIGDDQVALDHVIDRYVDAGRQAERDGMTWTADIQPIPPIYGQTDQLEAMLDELVANARESRSDQAPLAIHFATSVDSRGWVSLEIRDTGRGMSEETLVRAIEPFYSTKSGHLGVGLSIANGIWRRHRGTLSIRNHDVQGVVFRLCVEPCPRDTYR